MKKSITIVLFVSLFCVFSSFSQSNTGLDSQSSSNEFGAPDQSSDLNFLSDLSFVQQVSQDNATINSNLSSGNAVNINQIGNNNTINSQTSANVSNLELVQNGNSNFIDIRVNAPSLSENIIQNGNNNVYNDIIYNTSLDVGMNLIQNGNNLTVNRIGVNSLTNSLQLVQKGSFKTITIISN